MPTAQIPLYGEFTSKYALNFADSSNPGKTPYYLNGFFEELKSQNKDEMRRYAFAKRPGLDEAVTAGLTGLTGLNNGYSIQGMMSSLDKTKLIFYVNNGAANKSYFYDGTTLTDKGAPTGTWTNTGPVMFTQLDGISYSTTGFYAATDLSEGAIINSVGAWTRIADADFTGLTKVTNFCAMDGYLFIGDSRNRIYNSDLNVPTSWVATSFLTAADTPGSLVWLSRLRNYLIAFKSYSIEFFEDTGNPTPGSPLTAQKQLNKKVGLASRSSVKEVSDGIIFLGISEHGKLEMYKISKDDMSLKVISNQYLEEILGGFTSIDAAYSVDPKVSGDNRGQSQIVNFRGKEFYLISLGDGSNHTWVYDNDLGFWSRWSTCMTGANVLDNNYTPTQCVIFVKSGRLYNILAQNFLVSGGTAPFFQTIVSDGSVYADSIAPSSYFPFPLQWVSDIIDFGTRKRKFMDSLEVMYDSYAFSLGKGASTLTLTYVDSDYNTSSANNVQVTRSIPYAADGSQRAIARRFAPFRKRSFSLTQVDTSSSFPFRIWGVEIVYNIGEQDQDG